MKKFFLLILSIVFLAHFKAGAEEAYTTKEATKDQIALIKAAPQKQGFNTTNKTYRSQTWEKTTVATYTEGKLKVAFTNMVSPKAGQSLQTLSVFKGESEVTQFILDVQGPSEQPKNDSTFTGTMSLYTMDGQLLSKATYKNSVRTALTETPLEKIKLPSSFSGKKKKTDWGCVAGCLKGIYQTKLGLFCRKQCKDCFNSPAWGSCFTCAVCLVGTTAYCVNRCQK